jgi:peroxidase
LTTGCTTGVYNWWGTRNRDPSLNLTKLALLRKTCTNTVPSKESRVFLDQNTSGSSFVFDKSYFKMLTQHKGILETDQKLLTDPLTKAYVQPLADRSENDFANKFEAAIFKMGNLESTTVVDSKGKIRRVCSVLN